MGHVDFATAAALAVADAHAEPEERLDDLDEHLAEIERCEDPEVKRLLDRTLSCVHAGEGGQACGP